MKAALLDSGAYPNAEDVLAAAPHLLSVHNAAAPSPPVAPERPIWERIPDMMKDVPPEELAALPTDGAAEHDHYIYGTPKRQA